MSNPLKKTMVFLGLAEEDLDDQAPVARTEARDVPSEPAAPVAAPRPTVQRAPVTPLRKVTPTRYLPAGSPMNEILTLKPTSYNDATVVAENFRDGIPVIMNLSNLADGDAKRLIDFASGLVMGLHGQIEKVTSKVFLLTPEHIAVSGDDGGANDSGSFFVSPSA